MPLDADALARRLSGDATLSRKDVLALHAWLCALSPGAPVEECVQRLAAGARWVRSGRRAAVADEPAPTHRLRVLIDVLTVEPTWGVALAGVLARALSDCDAATFLEAGLPNDRGLWEETADRLARRLLPSLREPRELSQRVARVLPDARDAAWLASLPVELSARLCALVPDAAARPLRQAVRETVALLALRTAALGLSRELRARTPEVPLAASAFFLLPAQTQSLLDGALAPADYRKHLFACRGELHTMLLHLEDKGVSVDVVYRIDVIEQGLDRIADLLELIDSPFSLGVTGSVGKGGPVGGVAGVSDVSGVSAVGVVGPIGPVGGAVDPAAAIALVARLVEAHAHRSIGDVLRINLRLLARKIVERAGQTGEHYITRTRREFWTMLASAVGGGVLTAGTAALKYVVLRLKMPLFVEGVLSSLNYAGSFITMQLLGFTLATKQPSMTAAALARSLHEDSDGGVPRLDTLVTLIARICRSQLAAAIGNIGAVIPASIVFHLLFVRRYGHPFLDVETAEHALQSLHPFHSGTIFFAALTGVFLWMSSLCAGWVENWATYRRLPDAIEQRRPRRLTGFIARWLRKHIAGIGGNVSAGFLLGMSPVIGRFLGVPLEVRHVTLSTGTLAQAVCTLGVHAPGVFAAAAGISVILLLNFTVSFTLALNLALRARGVDRARFALLRAVAARFMHAPAQFFLPPRGEVGSEPAQH